MMCSGQVSGFLAKEEFLNRFGQMNDQTQKLYFLNVRADLIVAVVSSPCQALDIGN